jgi:hypothetical protein
LESLSSEEIANVFRPNERFISLAQAHTPIHRIALYYHATYLEAFGCAAPYAPIPPRIIAHVAGVLGLPIPEPFVPYPYPTEEWCGRYANEARRGRQRKAASISKGGV